MCRMPLLSIVSGSPGCFGFSPCLHDENKNRLACYKMRDHMKQSQVNSLVPSKIPDMSFPNQENHLTDLKLT